MIDILGYEQVKTKVARKIYEQLATIAKNNPDIKGFSIISEKNNRGEYGYYDIYKYNNQVFFIVSVDGAKVEIQYFVSSETDKILKSIEDKSNE